MFNAYEGYDHEKEKERQRGELVDKLLHLLQSKCSQSKPWDDPEENILRVRRERVLKANRLRRLNKL